MRRPLQGLTAEQIRRIYVGDDVALPAFRKTTPDAGGKVSLRPAFAERGILAAGATCLETLFRFKTNSFYRVNDRAKRSAMALRPLGSRNRVPVAVNRLCRMIGSAKATHLSCSQANQSLRS